MHIALRQIADVLSATPLGLTDEQFDTTCTGISTDSRNVAPSNLFIALEGESFDGHDFVWTAIDLGAIAVVVHRPNPDPTLPQLVVSNTLTAYQTLGRWWRDTHDIPIIAITGSVGKTTTKELIAAVLETNGSVLKTQGNYNNEIGVPKTLLQLNTRHDYAVVEMAMRGRGQIAELTQISRPDISVITNVGTAHIGLLGSREAIAEAKCELLAEMSSTGIAILNHDNPLLLETASRVWSGKTITFGLEGGDLCGKLLDGEVLELDGARYPLPLPGRHNALNYLAALAVGRVLNVNLEPLTRGVSIDLPGGRAKQYELPNDILLLDETYNAGLESMLAALEMVAQMPAQRRIAVLGTMRELGHKSLEFHHQVGERVKALNLDALFVLAELPEAQAMAAGARGLTFVDLENLDAKNAHETLSRRLREFMEPGDRILLKASRSVALDRVVASLLDR
ncbi:MAG: UDP-N-acetylmuramoyl-tripeptide--D-alanyl-D-alanine ligase [Cyanobacteria bacterium SID2]|nr:UDP-N-acetylmuramoyl-tripeptide--D-alanyl-D-alanine ligase [Cyanobacteria bacterium SID2]MBP0003888.1 UDP-N-acetylmuramoyl-tripeptide--D-alanyl-D-alanine ligase [Cyanobacteria bacterium SBC]